MRRTGRWRLRRTGTEPVTAFSDLRLRMLLSVIFTPVFVVATVLLCVWWLNAEPDDPVGRGPLGAAALICAAASVVAVIDLVVVRRRLRDAGPGGRP
ncbi:DUF6343 family protein [Streptomyces sp. 6N223]|uniref:DUF6343 family protein n=1 Tax=Streptomyces sp. 6N223 TaxID=3457412 RepID=UPI003FD56EAE